MSFTQKYMDSNQENNKMMQDILETVTFIKDNAVTKEEFYSAMDNTVTKEEFNTEIGGIKREIYDMKGDINEIKGEISGIKGEIVEIKGEISGIKGEIVEIKGEISGINSVMVTKDYLDEKLADLRGDLVVLMRKEDNKFKTLVEILHGKDVLSDEEKQRILRLEPFPQLM